MHLLQCYCCKFAYYVPKLCLQSCASKDLKQEDFNAEIDARNETVLWNSKRNEKVKCTLGKNAKPAIWSKFLKA